MNKSVFQVIGACTVGILLLFRAQAVEFIPLGDLPIQVDKLLANDGMAFDHFGKSVAVSGDTVVIGSTGASNLGVQTGAAYVFVHNGTIWIRQATLLADDGAASDFFGTSVALSGDTAVIGAHGDDDLGSRAGSAYVFIRNGTSWTQQAKLLADDGSSSNSFGTSVALSEDTAVIGANGHNPQPQGTASGAAYVFVRNGTSWTQQAELVPNDGAPNDKFGSAVAVSGDTAFVGAIGHDHLNAGGSSSAYVFVRNGTSWTQQAELTGAGGENFGTSVAVSDGTALIGATHRGVLGGEGAAHVFVRNGTSWTQQAELVADDGAVGEEFGSSVSVSGDTAVISASGGSSVPSSSTGSAYIFVRNGTSWIQHVKLLADDAAVGDGYGKSVGVSGGTAVIGAYLDDDLGTDSGSAYVFTLELDVFLDLEALADVNGNNSTDLGVLLRDAGTGKNKLYVMDGGSGNNITTVPFESAPVRGSTTVPDATGDLVPEVAILLEGSLFAKVKDVVNNTLLGKPKFNANFDTVAFLSVGDVGGGVGPDVAMVGRDPVTGKVQAWVKDVASGTKVKSIGFDKTFVPFSAVAVANVGDTNAMEIAVLGINASGKIQVQVKDAKSGNLISKFTFNKKFTPLFFAAVPNPSGKLKHLAVLGRNASGVIQAQIKRVSNGTLVALVKFNKSYDPIAFISFADSNGSGGGEVGVVGVNATGTVRAQVKEIADGTLVKTIKFDSNYPPLEAIAVNGVAGTAQNEIAVLGQNENGDHRLQIKDLLTGDLVNKFPVP